MKYRSQRMPMLSLLLGVGWICASGLTAEAREAPDLDGDGVPNVVDLDIDNDGLPNAIDPNVDGGIALLGPYAGRYIGDHLNNDNPAELDIDGDGLNDDSLGERDIDGDANPDDADFELDIDGDGRNDDSFTELDLDGDSRNDDALEESDIDGDGREDDDDENEEDIDGDGIPDDDDDDIDGDGKLNSSATEDDVDGDGRKNDDPLEDNVDGDSLNNRDDDDDDNDGRKDDDDPDHRPEEDEKEMTVELRRVDAPSNIEAEMGVQRFAFGEIKMEIGIEGLIGRSIDIVIDGVVRDTLSVVGGSLEVKYEADPENEDERLLSFEILGKPVELRQGEMVLFEGDIPDAASGVEDGGDDEG